MGTDAGSLEERIRQRLKDLLQNAAPQDGPGQAPSLDQSPPQPVPAPDIPLQRPPDRRRLQARLALAEERARAAAAQCGPQAYDANLRYLERRAQAFRRQGALALLEGADQDALLHFQKAADYAPGSIAAQVAVARLHERQGAYDKAVEHYRIAFAYRDLPELEDKIVGLKDKARHRAEERWRLSPDETRQLQDYFSKVFDPSWWPQQAKDYLQLFFELPQNPGNFGKLAALAYERDFPDKPRPYRRQMGGLHGFRAWFLQEWNSRAGMAEALELARRFDPTQAPVYCQLAEMHERDGARDTAKKLYRTAFILEPWDERTLKKWEALDPATSPPARASSNETSQQPYASSSTAALKPFGEILAKEKTAPPPKKTAPPKHHVPSPPPSAATLPPPRRPHPEALWQRRGPPPGATMNPSTQVSADPNLEQRTVKKMEEVLAEEACCHSAPNTIRKVTRSKSRRVWGMGLAGALVIGGSLGAAWNAYKDRLFSGEFPATQGHATMHPAPRWQFVAKKAVIRAGEYAIDYNITVLGSGQLEIRPGTTLRFTEDAGIVSYGTLAALGTPQKPILFTALRDAWKNISLIGPGASRSALRHCQITKGGGSSLEPFSSNARYGGGLAIKDANPDIQYCLFENNHARKGGALFAYNARPDIVGCTLRYNHADEEGGGIFLDGTIQNPPRGGTAIAADDFASNSVVITICDVRNNTAAEGAGMYLANAASIIAHCTIQANQAAMSGGGLYLRNVQADVFRNLIVGNNAVNRNPALVLENARVEWLNYNTITDAPVP